MAGAYVLTTVEPGNVRDVLTEMRKIDDILEAHAVTGPYDIIAKVEGKDIEEIGKSVVSKIQTLEGVERTLTALIVEL